MPPQQTEPASQSGRDAAVRGPGLTIGLVKEATDDTRNLLGLLEQCWRAFGEWRQRLRSHTALHELSDRELKDIGVTRDEIGHLAPDRAVDALRDSIHARGVM